jgi:hypothetical protein
MSARWGYRFLSSAVRALSLDVQMPAPLGLRFSHAPRLPDAGQVIPFNDHGADLYITLGQSQLYNWALGTEVFAVFFAVLSIL